jgi:hypothetical protein
MPRVFISYSHDSDQHAERVLQFADRLTADGILVELDQYNKEPAEGWPLWTTKRILEADFVLMVCTKTYYKRLMGNEKPGTGLGVKWEGNLIYNKIYQNDTLDPKFIPVLFSEGEASDIPDALQGLTRYRIDSSDGYDDLYRRLTNQPYITSPRLGLIKTLPIRSTRRTPEQETEKIFWNHVIDKYGYVHYADRSDPCYHAGIALVFIHGILGDSLETWGDLPEQVLKLANVDIDVFTFSYPKRLWESASNEDAAESLGRVLIDQFPARNLHQASKENWPHLIVAAYSNGGLIFKELLRREKRPLSPRRGALLPFDALNSIAIRTRHVTYIAVPHNGGDPLVSSFVNLFYHLVYFLCLPFLYGMRLLSQGTYDFGYHRIVWQLLWNNKWATALHQSVLELERTHEIADMPYPICLDIIATQDLAVKDTADANDLDLCGRIRIRGNHSTVKSVLRETRKSAGAQGVSHLVAKKIAQIVRRFTDLDVLIAYRSIGRAFELDRRAGITELLGPKTDAAGSQLAVFERSETLVQQYQSGYFVITGVPGVGKSIVLRRLVRTGSIRYMRDCHASKPLVLFFPLQQIRWSLTIEQFTNPEVLLRALLTEWCDWFKRLQYGEVTSDLLMDLLRRKNSVLAFDGVDEFLANNPQIRVSVFTDMLSFVERSEEFEGRILVVLGVRRTQSNIERLARNALAVLCLEHISVDEAARMNPGLKRLLEALGNLLPQNDPVWEIVLTPLVLRHLERVADSLAAERLLHRAGVLGAALEGMIMGSNLLPMHRDLDSEDWIAIMSLVGWYGFLSLAPEFSTRGLREWLDSAHLSWKEHHGSCPSVTSERYLRGLSALEDDGRLLEHVQRVLLLTTDHISVRFNHIEWATFLASKYFESCVRSQNFRQFGSIGVTMPIVETSTALSKDIVITPETISVLTTHASSGPFVRANFCAYLVMSGANGPIPTRQALRRLFADIGNMEHIAQFVVLNGLGTRALVPEVDAVAKDVRNELEPIFRVVCSSFRTCGHSPFNAILASTSWCHLCAFSSRFGTAPPKSDEWPDLGPVHEHEQAALDLMCDVKCKDRTVRDEHVSMQSSMVTIVEAMLSKYNWKVINCVHYLYYLVVACKYRVEIARVREFLNEKVFSNDKLETLVGNYEHCGRLKTIFTRMKQSYLENAS